MRSISALSIPPVSTVTVVTSAPFSRVNQATQ